MQGIKITTTSGEVKFIACYYYERKGDKLVTLGENNELTGDPTETALIDMGFKLDVQPAIFNQYPRSLYSVDIYSINPSPSPAFTAFTAKKQSETMACKPDSRLFLYHLFSIIIYQIVFQIPVRQILLSP